MTTPVEVPVVLELTSLVPLELPIVPVKPGPASVEQAGRLRRKRAERAVNWSEVRERVDIGSLMGGVEFDALNAASGALPLRTGRKCATRGCVALHTKLYGSVL